ncbi:MAG TPA: type III-B CRISPR module RAMP protein Cmr6 [Terriglobales bacterium]|nr:type III-B CRISPR module RAMP protein Cmr6 [Terriglobales bacterium]
MPIAAVPAYLGKDFADASPGMRFGLLLPIWTNRQDQEAEVNKRAQAKSREGDEVKDLLKQGMDVAIRQLRQRQSRPLPGLWDKNDFAARNAWSNIRALTKADQDRMKGILARQSALSKAVPVDTLFHIDAIAIAPFTTGLGNEHPLENGFAFLNPYGLPYLPGSGVKGVLRQAARELASGDWGDTHEWSKGKRFPLMEGEGEKLRPVLDKNNRPVMLAVQDVFFGLESDDGDSAHLRGALTFWDVIPQIDGDSLMVEIMTPHQTHYYQQEAGKGMGSSNPHESGQPTPISFLTVPPGSGFTFHVQCDLAHLRRLAPELAADGKWKTLITDAFEHAFQWLGFGAKTAVGYGAMLSEAQRKAREAAEAERAAQRKEVARKREEALRAEQAVRWQSARIKFNRNNGALTAEKDGKTAIALQPKGQELLTTLPTETQKKVLANQFVKVTAYVFAGTLVRVETP